MMISVKENSFITSNHIALVTSSTLSKLKVLNQTWLSLSLLNITDNVKSLDVRQHFEIFEKRKNDFVVQIVCYDSNRYFDFFKCEDENEEVLSLQDNVLYVSPASLFNIFKCNIEQYRNHRTDECKVDFEVLHDYLLPNDNNFATDVDISPISCPFGGTRTTKMDELLKDYFDELKCLCPNEIFPIILPKISKEEINAPATLWFKVNSLGQDKNRRATSHTNALFVNSKLSNLYLSNPVNAYVPQCACIYKKNLQLSTFFSNVNFKDAFKDYISELSGLFQICHLKNVRCKDTTILLEGPRGVGKGLIVQSVCEQFCFHFHEENCFDLISDSLSATEKKIENLFKSLQNTTPCVLYLKNVHLLCKDKEGLSEERRILDFFTKKLSGIDGQHPVIAVGSTYTSTDISARFYAEFLYHIKISSPNENQRECLIRAIAEKLITQDSVFASLSKKTAGFILSDFIGLFARAKNNMGMLNSKSLKFPDELLYSTLEEIRTLKAGSSDSVRIPKVTWDDVGGLQDVKVDIMDTIELPLKFPQLFSSGLRRSGLLFYGPPGCGKTLLAKAIANEFTLNFYSVKGPELINMYVGQSEENVREVFNKARIMAPCIIFFDELDSLAPNRGRSGDSGGVMDRIVSQLLSELDGMHSNTDVFIIGATNRPDLLDPALLRPGRFDKMIYVGIAENREERLRILKAVTIKLDLHDDVCLEKLVDLCPVNLTGADYHALASEAVMSCYRRIIELHEKDGNPLNREDAVISLFDFQTALLSLVPSVSEEELKRYEAIRQDILNKK